MNDPLSSGTGASVLERALAAYNAVVRAAAPPAPGSSSTGCIISSGYVNPANGNLMVQLAPPQASTTDVLPTFTFNSLSSNQSLTAVQWNSTFDRFIENQDMESTNVFTGYEWFLYEGPDDTGLFTTPPGARTRLQQDLAGNYIETQADGSSFFYDVDGTLQYRVRPVNRIFQTDRVRGMMFGAPS